MRVAPSLSLVASLFWLVGCVAPQMAESPPAIVAEPLAPTSLAAGPMQPPANANVHVIGSGPVACAGHPLAVDVSGVSVDVTDECRIVVVAGWHNNVTVGVAPGGILVVSGSHNDIFWHATANGRRPDLRDVGSDNTFHSEGG